MWTFLHLCVHIRTNVKVSYISEGTFWLQPIPNLELKIRFVTLTLGNLSRQHSFVKLWLNKTILCSIERFLMSAAAESRQWGITKKEKSSSSTRQGQTGIKSNVAFRLVRQSPMNAHCIWCQVYHCRSAPVQIYCADPTRPGQHPVLSKEEFTQCSRYVVRKRARGSA